MEEIEIEIAPNGKVTLRTKGIKGPRCVDVAQLFVELVGRAETRELTGEYYESEVEIRRQQEQRQQRR
jgi:hypothetical protein